MKPSSLNLFIVDDDISILTGLKNYLSKRFGTSMIISTFSNGRNALTKVDGTTDIVILDYNLKGENGNEILKSIKEINPKTEVIMLTSNEDITVAIESFREGAKDVVIKGNQKAWTRVSSIILNIVNYPINLLVKEFGFSKYFAIFITTFVVMAVVVFVVLKYFSEYFNTSSFTP